VSTVLGIEEESTMDGNDDRIIKLADHMPADMRYVEPSTFLMSTDCRVNYILTEGNKLLDAHELEVLKRGVKFREYGDVSADNMIGSKTTHGHLMTLIGYDSGRIEHAHIEGGEP
jgi:hypothetical protein